MKKEYINTFIRIEPSDKIMEIVIPSDIPTIEKILHGQIHEINLEKEFVLLHSNLTSEKPSAVIMTDTIPKTVYGNFIICRKHPKGYNSIEEYEFNKIKHLIKPYYTQVTIYERYIRFSKNKPLNIFNHATGRLYKKHKKKFPTIETMGDNTDTIIQKVIDEEIKTHEMFKQFRAVQDKTDNSVIHLFKNGTDEWTADIQLLIKIKE